jgi:hypothetical protein
MRSSPAVVRVSFILMPAKEKENEAGEKAVGANADEEEPPTVDVWFGHYLKNEPARPWITSGVSVLERERELKRASKKGS